MAGTLLFMSKEFSVIVVFLLILLSLKLGLRIFIVTSGSMEPYLKTGSVVASVRSKEYKKGDIVAFSSGNGLIIHRIVGVSDGRFFTKGDSNNTVDIKSILPNQVLGKVFFSLPYAGYFLKFCLTFPGFLMLVVFPAVFILLSLR